jgi:hypothetical protein
MRNFRYYKLIIWAALIISILMLVLLIPSLFHANNMPADDFVRYWASGRLLLSGENPYDTERLMEIQHQLSAAPPVDRITSLTLNPPWVLLILAPFSILSYEVSRLIWLLVNILLLLISVNRLWIYYHGTKKNIFVAWIIGFSLAPTLSVLISGQISAWVLLGLVGFLMYTDQKVGVWLAGGSMMLLSIKPHLTYLMWPAIGLWIISARKWKLLLTTMTIMTASIMIVAVINPWVFDQYLNALQAYPMATWATPTLGAFIRFFFLDGEHYWVQFIPSILCGALFFLYYKCRLPWIWKKELPLLILISICTTPYIWTYDLVVSLPAVLEGGQRITKTYSTRMIVLWSLYLIINLLDLILHQKLSDFWFVWLAPAYFVWYILCYRFFDAQQNKNVEE